MSLTSSAPLSVNYVDVGLRLDVEPNIYLDGEVAIKVKLEVSNLVREVLSRQATLTPAAAWQLCLKATQIVAARAGLRGTISDPRGFLIEVLRLAERRAAATAANTPGALVGTSGSPTPPPQY